MTIKDCENCPHWLRCFEENKDPDDAERALEEMEVCNICYEDSIQE